MSDPSHLKNYVKYDHTILIKLFSSFCFRAQMAAMLAMFTTGLVRLGNAAACTDCTRHAPLQYFIDVGEYFVEYTSAESTYTYANPHASSESSEPSESQR